MRRHILHAVPVFDHHAIGQTEDVDHESPIRGILLHVVVQDHVITVDEGAQQLLARVRTWRRAPSAGRP